MIKELSWQPDFSFSAAQIVSIFGRFRHSHSLTHIIHEHCPRLPLPRLPPEGGNLAACGSRASPSAGPPSGWQAGRVPPRGWARPIRLPQAFFAARVNFAGAFVN